MKEAFNLFRKLLIDKIKENNDLSNSLKSEAAENR
jgi:hypothetical protein